jgi:hypothetical protein
VSNDARCGWMREGGDMQCIYSAGHSGLHQWGPLPSWAFDDEEEYADYKAWLQKMPSMSGNSRCKV